MKKTLAFLIFAVLLASCADMNGDKQALAKRAEQWSGLLMAVKRMGESDALAAIQSFIEPSAGNDVRATEYFRKFTTSDVEVVRNSVDDVQIDSAHSTATVRYTTVNKFSTGVVQTATQLTHWKKSKGVWYRVVADADIRLNH